MEEGPFFRGHEVYQTCYEVARNLFDKFEGIGRTYETGDKYGGFWITKLSSPCQNTISDTDKVCCGSRCSSCNKSEMMRVALEIQACVNTHFGFPIIAKPDFHQGRSDDNPYVSDAIMLCLLPKSVALRAANYGGDPMAAALRACVDAGIEVRL